MIKCDFGKVDIHGIEPVILAELTSLMKALKDYMEGKHGKEYADDKIRSCVRSVFATKEELQEDMGRMLDQAEDKDMIEDMTEIIIGVLKKHYEEGICRKD